MRCLKSSLGRLYGMLQVKHWKREDARHRSSNNYNNSNCLKPGTVTGKTNKIQLIEICMCMKLSTSVMKITEPPQPLSFLCSATQWMNLYTANCFHHQNYNSYHKTAKCRMQLTSHTVWNTTTWDATCKGLSNKDTIQWIHNSLISDDNYCILKLWGLRPEKISVFSITYKLVCVRSSHMKFKVFKVVKTYTVMRRIMMFRSTTVVP